MGKEQSRFLILTIFGICCSIIINAQESVKPVSVFRDSLDRAYDMSDWLLKKKGVLVVPTIITEPAVDYGIAAAALYFHSSYSKKSGPPSVSGIVAGATLNGTWMGGILHAGFWKHDRIRYVGALARTNLNIGFYGSGNWNMLVDEAINLNMDAWLLLQQIKFRLGKTDLFLGGKYILYKTNNTFDTPVNFPEFSGQTFSSTLSEASVRFELDSRNNVFTPTKGVFVGISGSYSDTWFGGDNLYGRLGITLIGYLPVNEKIYFGIRHESIYSLGDIPFYARPIVVLRGAPLMKYQNRNVTVMEGELSYNVFKRWFISGFSGIGNAFSSFDDFQKGKSVVTVGTGFRYLIARKLGTHMGVDFGMSQDDYAIYIVFGTAWLR